MGLRQLDALLGEDLRVVEHAPGLEVHRVGVPLALVGHVAHVAGGQAQRLDDLIVGQVLDEAFLDQRGVQARVAHDDFGVVARSDRGLQLRPVVGALGIGDVLELDVQVRVGGLEGLFDRLEAGLLVALDHVVEHGDLRGLVSRREGGEAQHERQRQDQRKQFLHDIFLLVLYSGGIRSALEPICRTVRISYAFFRISSNHRLIMPCNLLKENILNFGNYIPILFLFLHGPGKGGKSARLRTARSGRSRERRCCGTPWGSCAPAA